MMKHIPLFLIACSLILVGCSTPRPIDTLDLNQLEHLSHNTVVRTSEEVGRIRFQVIQEAALSVGARSGLAYRSVQLNALLDNRAKTLDRIFNFSGLMLPHNVLPPVLSEGRDELNLASQDSIRLSDRQYKIIQQAQFVTAPPTWRAYLSMGYTKPAPPDTSLLPKTKAENKIWKYYVAQGWSQGIKQADIIYTDNLNRLQRDFKGMLLYRHLLSENMVSAPFVAKTNLGVTSEKGEMRINDQVLRITALPNLQTNSATWNPVVIKDHDE